MKIAPVVSVVLASASLLIAGCGGSHKPHSSPADKAALAFFAALKAGPYDIGLVKELGARQVARIRDRQSGEVFEIAGSKNAAGAVVELESLVRTDAVGQATTIDYLPGGDRAIASGDTQIQLKRQSGGKWLLEFTDLKTQTTYSTTLPDPALPTPASGAIGAMPALLAGVASSANKLQVDVRTSNCGIPGEPATPGVFVELIDGNGTFIGSARANRTGPGIFRAEFADPAVHAPISMEFVKSSLENLNSALDAACQADAASPLSAPQSCAYVASGMAATGVGAPLAGQFLAACEAGVVGLKITCAVKGRINLPTPDAITASGGEVVKSIESILIDMIPDEIFSPQVVAYWSQLPTNVYGKPVAVPSPSGLVNVSLDLPGLSVGKIVLTPAAPVARTPYTASADFKCIPFDSSAELSVVGSDGYTDRVVRSFPETTPSAAISLLVPGADTAGIRDTLTLSVRPRVGSPFQSNAYLMFR